MAGTRAQWTVLTYIAAHNDLDEFGRRSLAEILSVGSTPEVTLAVLFDGTQGATRYVAGEPGTAALQEPLGEFDSGSPAGLLDTARWAFEEHPAERYALVLWSHGTGWRPEEIRQIARQTRGDASVDGAEATERATRPGSLALFRTTLARLLQPPTPAERAVLFDDGTSHSLDTLQLAEVVADIAQIVGQPLDLLGMDACLMATLEVAYQVQPSVRYLVASEELVPGFSWPYQDLYSQLRSNPSQSADRFATNVVRHYTAYYAAHPPAVGDVTKVAVDVAHVDTVASAIDDLARTLSEDVERYASVLWAAQLACHKQESRGGTREPNKFRYHLWDIASLAGRLAGSDADALADSARQVAATLGPGGPAVLAEGHYGDWFDGIGGLAVYLVPPNRYRISPAYAELALARDTHWATMLRAYHDEVA